MDSATTVAGESRKGASTSSPSRALAAEQLVGSYYASSTDEVARIVQKDTTLVLELVGRTLPLKPTGGVTYAVVGLPVTIEFVADSAGPARALRIRVGSELRSEAMRFSPVAPSPDSLRALAGSYYSPELGVTWTAVMNGDHLELRNSDSPLVDIAGALAPTRADEFTAGSGLIRFTRDGAGRVTGFEVSSSRMRGIRFDKRSS